MAPLDEERDLETLRQISHLLTRENQRLLAANLELRAELARLRGEPEVTQLAFTVEQTVPTRPSVPSVPVAPRAATAPRLPSGSPSRSTPTICHLNGRSG